MNKRFLVTCIAGVSAILFATPPAYAVGTYTGVTKLTGARAMTCQTGHEGQVCGPSLRDRVTGSVNWGRTFSDVSQLCVTFAFKGDFVDPGESLEITFGEAVAGDTSGFINLTGAPIKERTLCLDSTFHPQAVELFRDGSQNFIVYMTVGSARLASVTFALTGT